MTFSTFKKSIQFFYDFLLHYLFPVFKASGIHIAHESVVVDENFQTNVPNVYALGKFIKLSKEPNHQYIYVDPMELAQKVN